MSVSTFSVSALVAIVLVNVLSTLPKASAVDDRGLIKDGPVQPGSEDWNIVMKAREDPKVAEIIKSRNYTLWIPLHVKAAFADNAVIISVYDIRTTEDNNCTVRLIVVQDPNGQVQNMLGGDEDESECHRAP